MHERCDMAKNPYISVICPCYNGAGFIECAIQSVAVQPVDCLELIIVDDGSTDDTGAICNKYVSESVRYFKTENLGTGHARNYGLEQAKGTWIMYLDADDLYLFNALNQSFIEKLHEYEKQNVDIIYTPCTYVDFDLKKWIRRDDVEETVNVIPRDTFWNGIYRNEYLKNNDIRFYEYKEQDIESAFRYLAYSSAGRTVADNEMLFYLMRDNSSSNTHTWDLRKTAETKALIYSDLIKHHSNTDLSYRVLLAELLNTFSTYFRLVTSYGFRNKNKYLLVCKIAKEYLFAGDARRILGTKLYLKEIIRYIRCKLVAKETIGAVSPKINVSQSMIPSDTVMERLRIVSGFLLN